MNCPTSGFELSHHNVFFAEEYPTEFTAIFEHGHVCASPTVYLCAQDRSEDVAPNGKERLLLLVNAPAKGDADDKTGIDLAHIKDSALKLLEACGLHIDGTLDDGVMTTPTDFHQLFPGTGGALYGQAGHGMMANFSRPGARSRIPGLYLAGGSVHPGAGVPMAVMSGRLAAQEVLADSNR
jgi:1-hydroxycarotenoid 3,4-desaturase